MSTKDTERKHCEAVARKFESEAYDDDWIDFDRRLADIIERERAAARAQGRAEALEEAAKSAEGWSSNTTTWNNAVATRIRALKEKP